MNRKLDDGSFAGDVLRDELARLTGAVEAMLSRLAFDETLPECQTGQGNHIRELFLQMTCMLRDSSQKMIGLVEVLASSNKLYSEKIEELSSMLSTESA